MISQGLIGDDYKEYFGEYSVFDGVSYMNTEPINSVAASCVGR